MRSFTLHLVKTHSESLIKKVSVVTWVVTVTHSIICKHFEYLPSGCRGYVTFTRICLDKQERVFCCLSLNMRVNVLSFITSFLNIKSLLQLSDIHVRAQSKVFRAHLIRNPRSAFSFKASLKEIKKIKISFVWNSVIFLQKDEQFVVARHFSGEEQAEIAGMQSTEKDWNGPWVDVKPPQH